MIHFNRDISVNTLILANNSGMKVVEYKRKVIPIARARKLQKAFLSVIVVTKYLSLLKLTIVNFNLEAPIIPD